MVKQSNSQIVRAVDKLNETERIAVLEYISDILSTKSVPIHNAEPSGDDLIASLANHRENCRARQVLDWERVRRRSFPKAA
jgi:hypothetical protein